MRLLITLLIPTLLLFSGCDLFNNKHCDTETYTSYTPVYTPFDEFQSLIKNQDSIAVENIEKVYHYGNYTFINERNKGLHVFDYSEPTNPLYVTFISIPGNQDVVIKDDILIADSYSMIVSIDISTITNVTLTKIVQKALPPVYRNGYPMVDQNNGIITDWIVETHSEEYCHDGDMLYEEITTENFDSDVPQTSNTGKSGSLSRMALVDEYLYVVSNDHLNVIEVQNPSNPHLWAQVYVDWGLETLFSEDSVLFIGATNGMYIYTLPSPGNPKYASNISHATSCDPVVVEGNRAYVTLRDGSSCRNGSNELIIIDLDDLYQPKELLSVAMYNPHGLAIQDTLLYVCDGEAGVKVFDVSDIDNIITITSIPDINAQDIIINGDHATIMAQEGVYLYDISDLNSITQLSFSPATPGIGVE